MNPIDRNVLFFMAQTGGRFASCLANAWLSADAANSARLAQAFGHLYNEYAANYAASRVAA